MDINVLAVDIKEWADSAFPDRTDSSMFLKLYGEVAELIDAEEADCGDEIADLLILILDYAKRKGVNPSVVTQRKLNINKKRVWKKTRMGNYQHVSQSPCIPIQSGTGNGDANVGGQTLAYDRDDPYPNSCRTHGKCRAASLDDCAQFPGHILSATRRFAECDGPRSCRGLPRGYPDSFEAPNRPTGNKVGGSTSLTDDLPTSGGYTGVPRKLID